MGKLEGKRPLGKLNIDGRIKLNRPLGADGLQVCCLEVRRLRDERQECNFNQKQETYPGSYNDTSSLQAAAWLSFLLLVKIAFPSFTS